MKQTGQEFRRMVADTFDNIKKLTATKGEEYTRRDQEGNQHANFDRNAAELHLVPEKVLWIYLNKHLDSLRTYVNDQGAAVKPVYSESMGGRVDDAILYLLLLKGMMWREWYAEQPKQDPQQDQTKQDAVYPRTKLNPLGMSPEQMKRAADKFTAELRSVDLQLREGDTIKAPGTLMGRAIRMTDDATDNLLRHLEQP